MFFDRHREKAALSVICHRESERKVEQIAEKVMQNIAIAAVFCFYINTQ